MAPSPLPHRPGGIGAAVSSKIREEGGIYRDTGRAGLHSSERKAAFVDTGRAGLHSLQRLTHAA